MFVTKFAATVRAVLRAYLAEHVSPATIATESFEVRYAMTITGGLVELEERIKAYVRGFDVAARATS
jgi:hypothetical protein